MFIIPQSIVKMVDECCRKFLWGTKTSGQVISLVNWEQVCTPWKNGGLGLRRCGLWNKALLGNQIWDIAAKGDSLWVKWVHGRYIKHDTIWNCEASSNSTWHGRKLLQIRDLLLPAVENGGWRYANDGRYTPKSGYVWFLGGLQDFPLASSIWHKFVTPKNGFLMWLAVQGKLLTRERLER